MMAAKECLLASVRFCSAIKRGLLAFLPVLIVASILVGVVSAQSGGGYDLSWWTVDGGGGVLNQGGYSLHATAGQPDAGSALESGGYTLLGGFWPSSASGGYTIYLPVVIRR